MRKMIGDEGKYEYKKGLWTVEEDKILMDYVKAHGKGHWNRICKKTGLKRCGKSCRLRWMNYLSPNVKRGNFTEQEEDLIIRLHKLLGNRWSLIAKRVPGRTDNQVKNYWNTHLSKKLGIKDQIEKPINGGDDDDQTNLEDSTTKILSEEKCPNINLITRNDGTDEKSNMNQMFSDLNNRQHQIVVPVIGGEGNYVMNSLWVHEDDFEFSTLSNMMDFMEGYCF